VNFEKGRKLAIVAAHPDDEVLGCGGAIAKAIDKGMGVFVLFLGEGISARFPVGQYDNEEFRDQTRLRMEGSKKALSYLGVKDIIYDERLCGQFEQLPIISITKRIEWFLEKFKPNILLTHSPNEVNIDHQITYKAVEIATRPTRNWLPDEIYTFEIVCSGHWTFEGGMVPNTFVDVSPYWEKKLKAWHHYEGESRPFPFPRSDKGLETLANLRGMESNLPMAEAYRLLRKIVF
jgi:LmbE family N-acetylglucosaminyl deacetylase